jgi:hypothetical protein
MTFGLNYFYRDVNGSAYAVGGNSVGGNVNGSARAIVVNDVEGDVNGRLSAAVNIVRKTLKGSVSGLVSTVNKLRGNQRGILFNYCGPDSEGTQFGLICYQSGGEGKWYDRLSLGLAVRKSNQDKE